MVAHQWENALNYAYYDALHGGYPLVHNSDMLPDGVGYRYHDFDVHEAACVLMDAIEHHDERAPEYDLAASRFLATVNALHPANVEAHAVGIYDLWQGRQAA